MSRALRHLVYSNAPADGGSGFRVVLRPPEWPEQHARALELWLRSLHGPDLARPGLATAAFRIGGELHACVAMVNAHFGSDAHGRPGGTLVHVLGVAVDEGRDVGLHSAALVNLALRLHVPEPAPEDRLTTYLATIQEHAEAEVLPPSLQALAILGTEVLSPFLAAARAALASPQPMPEPLAVALAEVQERSPAEVLAAASGALPPRMRLALRWADFAMPGAAVHLVTGRRCRDAPPSLDAKVERYVAWVLAELEKGHHEPVRAVLCDWRIRSWDELLRAVASPSRQGRAG